MRTLSEGEILTWLQAHGQKNLSDYLRKAPAEDKSNLLKQIATLDLNAIEKLLVDKEITSATSDHLEPIAAYKYSPEQQMEIAAGEKLIREGKVAIFTVAGGQGTRLGYPGPKGCFPVTPVRKRSLFEVFALKLRAAQSRYGVTIPWVIMTSPENNSATINFFEKNNYFGLLVEQFFFFVQGTMPALDATTGQMLLESPSALALNPDGHGGSIKGLHHSGALAWLKERRITTLSYFQVDNPFVPVVHPAFLGAHVLSGSQFSSKSIAKRTPEEKVGLFIKRNGVVDVIEYSNLPTELAHARNPNGELTYAEGNVATHILSVELIEKVAVNESLPYHRAHKKVPYWSPESGNVTPEKPNATKFEQFVFDAIAHAQNPIVVRVLREDEFSPVKNAEGDNSPQTCHDDQLRQWVRWLRAAGVNIEADDTGLPPFAFEVSPLLADSAAEMMRLVKAGDKRIPSVITRLAILE